MGTVSGTGTTRTPARSGLHARSALRAGSFLVRAEGIKLRACRGFPLRTCWSEGEHDDGGAEPDEKGANVEPSIGPKVS